MLATCVVALVAGIGISSTVVGYRALRRSGEQRAREVLHARGEVMRRAISDSLGTADVLLSRLEPDALRVPRALHALLERMYALAAARRGITWISASFPDGAFCGVAIDERGEIRGQISRADGLEQRVHRFAFDALGTPIEYEVAPDAYDPRVRPFYRLAATRHGFAWTEPYPFLPSLRPGISRVKAVYDPAGTTLHSVLTVDYDATRMTGLLEQAMTPRQRQVVLAADGAVLGASGVALPVREHLPREHPLRWTELEDAPLGAARSHTRLHAGDQATTIAVDGEDWRLDQVRIGALDGRPITLISMLPEAELFAQAHAEARRGLVATALMALLGLALSAALSANIARLRRKRAEAEQVAARALSEVAELGSYRLLSEIGAGGMAAVYRARHTLLARDAALKLIDPADGKGADQQRAALFFEEARTLASLRSVHTVAVYDFGVAADGRYFLAMELLDGLDLDELVRKYGPQPPARVASILAQACVSLAEAHAAGLVHRDIKPANVFLCRLADWLDVAKVLDFGLTRKFGSAADSGLVEGTPEYMSPEQALGELLGPASDLYALGCVGFCLLAGRAPYRRASAADLMEAHVVAPIPELPAEVRAACPALAQIVTRCMAKQPEHRPSSAAALGRALRQVAADSAASFPDEALRAFWDARALPSNRREAGPATEPMISVSLRRRAS